MNDIPKIKIIRDNLDEEVAIFSSFLYHPYFTQARQNIFNCFPELAAKIEGLKQTESKNEIRRFLIDFYGKNKERIGEIISESEDLAKRKSEQALRELAKLMNYEWSEQITYKAFPTVLPFSPFKDTSFNFSILARLRNQKSNRKNFLFVAIHEISHFIFFEIMSEIKKENALSEIPRDTQHYFKEALTAVLLNQKPLHDILELVGYKGNPEIQGIRIKKKDGSILSFQDFISEQYECFMIKEKKVFKEFLLETTKILLPLQNELSEKWEMWKKYGYEIYKNEKLSQKYGEPIKIK